jgi:hypothetical protein
MLDLWFGLDASGFDRASELVLAETYLNLLTKQPQLNSTAFLDLFLW